MDNEKKCDKYEALFVFRSDDELKEHIKECPECQKEYETQMKISALVKEVAPVYLNRQDKWKTRVMAKMAACFVMLVGITGIYTGYCMYSEDSFQVNSAEDSFIESNMGLPTDDYGFLEI